MVNNKNIPTSLPKWYLNKYRTINAMHLFKKPSTTVDDQHINANSNFSNLCKDGTNSISNLYKSINNSNSFSKDFCKNNEILLKKNSLDKLNNLNKIDSNEKAINLDENKIFDKDINLDENKIFDKDINLDENKIFDKDIYLDENGIFDKDINLNINKIFDKDINLDENKIFDNKINNINNKKFTSDKEFDLEENEAVTNKKDKLNILENIAYDPCLIFKKKPSSFSKLEDCSIKNNASNKIYIDSKIIEIFDNKFDDCKFKNEDKIDVFYNNECLQNNSDKILLENITIPEIIHNYKEESIFNSYTEKSENNHSLTKKEYFYEVFNENENIEKIYKKIPENNQLSNKKEYHHEINIKNKNTERSWMKNSFNNEIINYEKDDILNEELQSLNHDQDKKSLLNNLKNKKLDFEHNDLKKTDDSEKLKLNEKSNFVRKGKVDKNLVEEKLKKIEAFYLNKETEKIKKKDLKKVDKESENEIIKKKRKIKDVKNLKKQKLEANLDFDDKEIDANTCDNEKIKNSIFKRSFENNVKNNFKKFKNNEFSINSDLYDSKNNILSKSSDNSTKFEDVYGLEFETKYEIKTESNLFNPPDVKNSDTYDFLCNTDYDQTNLWKIENKNNILNKKNILEENRLINNDCKSDENFKNIENFKYYEHNDNFDYIIPSITTEKDFSKNQEKKQITNHLMKNFKTEICKFFLKKACTKGEKCSFSHDTTKFPCKAYHLRKNCTRKICNFSHEPIDQFALEKLQDTEPVIEEKIEIFEPVLNFK
ncbi:Zinc finger CCCH domain-containing protein 6 [Gurleya vavrai]